MLIVPIEAIIQRCSVKKIFLRISQNSQESTCRGVSFSKEASVCSPHSATLLKKRLWQVFAWEFRESFKKTFFTDHPQWLRLYLHTLICNKCNLNIECILNNDWQLLKCKSKICKNLNQYYQVSSWIFYFQANKFLSSFNWNFLFKTILKKPSGLFWRKQ